MSDLRYEIWTAPVSLDSYKPDWTPRPNELEMCGFWPCVALVGESGKSYCFMLSLGDSNRPVFQLSDASVITEPGFNSKSSPLLIDGKDLRKWSRYEYEENDKEVIYRLKNGGYVRIDPNGYDWVDCDGKINLNVQQKGEGVFFRIPKQDRIEYPIYHQSQTGLVTGTIDGDPVFGLSLLDYVWSKPNTTWVATEAFCDIEEHWTMWLAEFEDGTFDGGYAWKGKDGFHFNAGHLIQDGVSSACQQAKTQATWGSVGLPEKLHIDYGGQYDVDLEFTHQADWPFHPVGHVNKTSSGKAIKRSIAITEWVPRNVRDLLTGKYPECANYTEIHTFDSVIVDHCVVPRK